MGLPQRHGDEPHTAEASGRIRTTGPDAWVAQAPAGRPSQPPSVSAATGGGRASASVPPSSDFERWFESIRPPMASLPEVALERRPEPERPRRQLGLVLVAVVVGLSACIGVAALVARAQRTVHARAETAETAALARPMAVPTAAAATLAAATESPRGEASPPPSPEPASQPAMGELVVASSKAHRSVLVDGHPAGAGHRKLQLACGTHTVAIAGGKASRSVTVPCGGSISVTL